MKTIFALIAFLIAFPAFACDNPDDLIVNNVPAKVWKGGPVNDVVYLGEAPTGSRACLDQIANKVWAGQIEQGLVAVEFELGLRQYTGLVREAEWHKPREDEGVCAHGHYQAANGRCEAIPETPVIKHPTIETKAEPPPCFIGQSWNNLKHRCEGTDVMPIPNQAPVGVIIHKGPKEDVDDWAKSPEGREAMRIAREQQDAQDAAATPAHMSLTFYNRDDGTRSAIIKIDGLIVPGDADHFKNLIAQANPRRCDACVIVELRSDGGVMGDAISIGWVIHEKKFDTLVESGDLCLSACADIWLAGNVRGMVNASFIVPCHLFERG